ncbi:MAG: DUF3103 family protein [Cyclobacteriaceae bacterium]
MILYLKTQKAVLALMVTAFLFGCQTVKDEAVTPELALPEAEYSTEDAGYNLAQSLAVALQSSKTRHFVKNKIDERFDGDANFLFALEKDQPLGGDNARSLTFSQALFGAGEANSRTMQQLKDDPLLQIALRKAPGVTKDWNPDNEHPIVVYLPYATNTDQISSLPAFDQEGNYFAFDVTTFPTEPILVISHNERVKPVSRSMIDKLRAQRHNGQTAPDDGCLMDAEPILVTEEDYYYTTGDLYCGGQGGGYVPGGLNGGTGTQSDCDRDDTELYDHISRVKFINMKELNDAEWYFHGAPEVYFFVFTGSSQGHLQSFQKFIPKVDHSEWKDCPILSDCYTEWHYPDLEVMYWDKATFGETIKYQWFEQDLGDPIKFSTTYSTKLDDGTNMTLSFEVTISDKDFNLGHSIVNFCEDATATDYKVYETGKLYYALELR